jgi:putative CocE/NonD family hydrolase
MRQINLMLFLLIICLTITMWAQTPAPTPDTEKNSNIPPAVDLTWGVKIPMRDGVHLNATVYRPHEQKEPLPVLVELTPYVSAPWDNIPFYYARHGYVFALVESRGRGNSEGKFNPSFQEPQDGYDVVEWLAKQPWSNGKIAMLGGSYVGFNQWMTLREHPPHLATIFPAASAHVDAENRILDSGGIQWLTVVSGVTGNHSLYQESPFWIEKFTEMYRQHLPFRDLDKIVGNTTTVWREWLQHPVLDSYWKRLEISPDEYKQIHIPILTVTGSNDANQGALAYYKEHMRYGTDEAKAQHYLIIGPWDHGGSILETKKEVGGLTFGDASLLDWYKLHTDWYDWTLKNGKKPEFLKKRVAYYVMGADQWKYADSLESISNATRTLYLDFEHGHANDVTSSGGLADSEPGTSEPDHYTYDPLDTRSGEQLEQEEIKNYLTDQRFALNLFGNGVVYHSEPFAKDTEISGFVKLTVWMAMDVPDTDFSVTLYEILLDGSSVQLTSAMMRARHRDSMSEEKLVKPGEIVPYVFNGFAFFSRQIAKGSRLRLVLSCPNSIYLEKNYNSGGVVADETAKDARTAHITVYHDAQHPSRLELPLVE